MYILVYTLQPSTCMLSFLATPVHGARLSLVSHWMWWDAASGNNGTGYYWIGTSELWGWVGGCIAYIYLRAWCISYIDTYLPTPTGSSTGSEASVDRGRTLLVATYACIYVYIYCGRWYGIAMAATQQHNEKPPIPCPLVWIPSSCSLHCLVRLRSFLQTPPLGAASAAVAACPRHAPYVVGHWACVGLSGKKGHDGVLVVLLVTDRNKLYRIVKTLRMNQPITTRQDRLNANKYIKIKEPRRESVARLERSPICSQSVFVIGVFYVSYPEDCRLRVTDQSPSSLLFNKNQACRLEESGC